MIKGINHITLSVSDLEKSFNFYVSTLGLRPKVRWKSGAYLSAGDLWLCLSLGDVSPAKDYSHIAFDIAASEFEAFAEKLLSSGVKTWKENTSEGASLYIVDPDGHKLEIHAGSLESRLGALRTKPYEGIQWY